ncbi:MAG: hypothetical protein AMXMBFR84_47100 [Candidatus Hydrogenedentota bacterium]
MHKLALGIGVAIGFCGGIGLAQDSPAPQSVIQVEVERSAPDYIVYVPKSIDGSTFDTGNEHFLVFDGPDKSLMAVWTQSSHEGAGDHRIMFSRSDDNGKTWAAPTRVVGPERPAEDSKMCSWGFPMTSKSGRIYVLYNQETSPVDHIRQHTGRMDGVYSDDLGKTWSAPQNIPMERTPWDNPDTSVSPNWVVWQKPERDLNDRYYVGMSRWVSPRVRDEPPLKSWTADESVVNFMRFENIDENPEPKDIRITWFHNGHDALQVPHYLKPDVSIAQEPSIVRLPDQRLFCTMRTMSGIIWYSVSSDDGESWLPPRPLRRSDHGDPILEPICCCPIYEYTPGKYVLLHHNNDGRFNGSKPEEAGKNRRPAFIALGEFRPNADQPIWFSESKQFMDNDGQGIGPLKRIDIGVYPSVSRRNGEFVLWHPDRKFFLLGKRITDEWLADLSVPK